MRIHELAKEIGKRFNIENIKPASFISELREMKELEDIHEVIASKTSPSSSFDDDICERIIGVYQRRQDAPRLKALAEEEARKKAEEDKRLEEIRLLRQRKQQQQEKDSKTKTIEQAQRQREMEIQRRMALQQKGQPAPTPTPKPIQSAGGGRVAGLGPVIPLPSRKLPPSPPAQIHVPFPPASPAPMARPAALQPAPPASETREEAPQTVPAPTAAKTSSIRPTGTAAELRKAGPVQGFSSGPVQGRATAPAISDRTGVRPDGQPPPPPPPSLRMDSPFRMRPKTQPAPGRLPQAGDIHRPQPRPGQDDRRDSRGGPGYQGRSPMGFRAPDDRNALAPSAPRGERRGERAALVIPEIEVMKSPGRRPVRSGEKAKAPVAKKKALKTYVREEIEVKPSKIYGLADEFRRPTPGRTRTAPGQRASHSENRGATKSPAPPSGPVRIGSTITVGEFAEKINVPAANIIKQVFLMGKMLTINHLIEPDLCEVLAQEFNVPLEIQIEGDEQDIEQYRPAPDPENLVACPPVVTIMGHVDHGKTTLLDAYRSSKVALGEFGGITQHIGAYRVSTPRGEVTFLDTPGHEAFTSMRARGAQVTDIVVLVVGADDGVMPQTVEAINHAKAANVPIIVAINKMDLPQANPDRVRTELMQYQILPEALGGSNIFVEISAKKRTNLDELLEMILLQSDVLELKADPTCRAEGVIIESHVDPLRGAVATVLVEKGTLHLGDIFVVGTQSGRVRVMIDDTGHQVKEAGPSQPVEVIGLSGTPEVGELFLVMTEERIAREIASRRVDRRRMRDLGMTRHVTLEGLHDLVEEGKLKDLKIILKADVQGSLEAITQSLNKLSNEEVKVRILHKSTGGITESDVSLASASDAVIIGFNVRPDPSASNLAQHEGIEIKSYRVIYELIEEIQKAIIGMLDKRYKEVILGRAEIRQIFRVARKNAIAGCMVLSGEISRGGKTRLLRDNVIVYEGKIATLRREKDDVSKVASGYECGLMLENFTDIKEGDVIELFSLEELPAELSASSA